jgi:asparagine synthase (glutamine-hydrolysing)
MCGIYGIVSRNDNALAHPDVVMAMGEALRHRGPDGSAHFREPRAIIGTERLRIIDLHERADQPFASPDERVWLECNGEIYNSAAIRSRYRDYPYRSHSDVETILPLYLDRGTAAISELDGMFGLAIRDGRDGSLILARDRAGEKPLFYARSGDEVVFASELQCVMKHPGISRDLDPDAVADYLTYGYVLEPRTMFAAVRRVPAGAWIRFTKSGEQVVHYWQPETIPIERRNQEDAVLELRTLIEQAVTKQVMSDVPVGVFISGGMDSSILAALASKAIGVDKVHTFSAQFAEASYDESGDAAVIAERMRTRFVPVRADEETLHEALEAVTRGVAEPIADPAILPTYLLARAARERVKVVLSGEGADELFGGYPTYIGHKVAPVYRGIPRIGRRALEAIVNRLPSTGRKVTLEFLLKRFIAGADQPWQERHAAWFGTGLGKSSAPTADALSTDEILTAAMLLDYRSYLRDNLLVKVDRATMLSSVEARAPFLDRNVTAFALSLPADLRVRRFTTKWILKKAAEAWLPHDVIYRKKRGLSVPVASWINRGLRIEVDRLLAPARLEASGLDTQLIGRLLAEHRSHHANHAKSLWAVVMLQYWMENFGRMKDEG